VHASSIDSDSIRLLPGTHNANAAPTAIMGNRLYELPALKKLRQSDPEISLYDVFFAARRGYGFLLGNALTNKCSIAIEIGCLLSSDDIDNASARLAPLLDFLRTSPSLRCVKLMEGWHGLYASLISLIFAAIAQNPTISSLDLKHLRTPLECFHFLRTASSVKHLRIRPDLIPSHQAQLFVDALNTNLALEELELVEGQQTADWILTQISSHPRLRSLSLKAPRPFTRTTFSCSGISYCLMSTTALQDLTLNGYDFHEEEMTHLLAALASNHSVTRLRLQNYVLSQASSLLFARFVCHQCNQGTNIIRELHLKPDSSHYDVVTTYAKLVSSSLDVLCIDEQVGSTVMQPLFDQLTMNLSRATVPCLRVSFYWSNGIDAMIRYLPTTTTLRKFIVFGSRLGFLLTAEFRNALRQNGSLISLTIECYDGTVVDDPVLVTLRPYCQRNQMVRELTESIGYQPSPSFSNLTLFPRLFYVAQKARRTAPNAILLGLLAAGCDSIGHCASRIKPRKIQANPALRH
jgi:hypothetical protein